MSVLTDAVRSASRAARYERLRREEASGPLAGLSRALVVWGTPAIAPALAVAASANGSDRRTLEIGLVALVVLLSAHFLGRPRLHAFDLLHQPSRRGIVVAHVLARAPRLLWYGGMLAAAVAIRVPELRASIGGMLVVAAVFVAPFATALSAGASRVARRAGRADAASVIALVLPLLTWVATLRVDGPPVGRWALTVLAGIVAVYLVLQSRAFVATVRKALVVGLALGVAIVASMPTTSEVAIGVLDMSWLGALGVVIASAACGLSLRTQLSDVEMAEMVRSEAAPDETSETRDAPIGPQHRRRSAARGLWAARLGYLRDEWTPAAARWRDRVDAWGGLGAVGVLTVLRGPILAAMAVSLSSWDKTAVWPAVLGAVIAHRLGAVDSFDLDTRLWMLGVDYREQVLHGLRSLGLFAALPTLVAAVGALLLTGPDDAGRQGAVLVVAATLVLRSGLPGLWPLRETHRLRLGVIWAGVLIVVVSYGTLWPPIEAAYSATGAAVLGAVLLVVRFLRLREPYVADCVRRAEEP